MKRYYSILAVLLVVLGCTAEQAEIVIDLKIPVTFEASIESSEGKAALDGVKPIWSEGDAIAVYDGKDLNLFSLVGGAGTQVGTFSGSVTAGAGDITAVYPFSAAKLQNGVLETVVPEDQAPVTGGVDPEALVMKAVAPQGQNSLSFRNEVSLLRFSVPQGVTEVLVVPGGHPLVKLTLSGNAGTCHVALTPGDYNGLSVFCNTGKWYVKSTGKPLAATRNFIINIGELPLEKEAIPIFSSWQMKSFLASSSSNTGATAILLRDIDMDDADMQSQSYSPASDFAGIFEGNGFTVSNLNKPLFNKSHGTVRNMTLEGEYGTSNLEAASLVLQNYGSIYGVTSRVSLNVRSNSEVNGSIVIGGIAAYSYGSICNSVNDARITFTGGSSVKAAAIGGIAGYSEGPIENCSNLQPVSFSACYGSGLSEVGRISRSAINLGGILGAAYDSSPVRNCDNSGTVSLCLSEIEKSTAVFSRTQVGGIAGSPYGDIVGCRNSGDLDIDVRSSTGGAFNTYDCTLDIGGISGGSYTQDLDYQKANDNTSIIRCVNSGKIDIKLDSYRSNSTAGGIVGWPSGEKTGLKTKVSECENSGDISMSGGGKIRIGGIMGGTGNLENCNNSGSITLNSANASSCIGGICGFHSQDHGLASCKNTGDVISKAAINSVGGLIGMHGNVNLKSSAACSVDCKVENGSSDNAGVGIVLGRYNGTGKTINIGSPEQPIDVKGTVAFGGSERLIDEVNYSYYLSGTANTSENQVIYAMCTVPGNDNSLFAEGYVTYNGSEPAAGVSVSDGFRVAVTDNDGYYRLPTSSDTWYIYVSYPSDAVIERKGGNPAFFIRYNMPQTRYDFRFTRQAKETAFAVFALADPQAHYSKRSGQTMADTKRFLDESVPAINNQIASETLPCYGITLGDIVYSEGSRNSVPGMTTMYNSFGGVNMPVFQTMGNHDYTFFSSNRALTADANSSTLYLKAQREFENVFGPVNFSFNRGDVHFVCMRNIIFDSNTNASSYHGGFTDQQYNWLLQDLANVPKSRMIVLCVHIPVCGILSGSHVKDVLNLMKQYKSATVFSGHTHYKRFYSNLNSTGIQEHIHSAVCGQWWWSNIEGDGNPNGYTVYHFDGTTITDEYFLGVNNHMNTKDYQMRLYRGDITNGGSYAYFKWPFDSRRLLINLFNGDSRWKVKVYEDGVLSGTASLMSNSKHTYASVTAGQTYTVPASSNQDWWAIGYNIGVKGRGRTSTSYYTNMFHMWSYNLKSDSSAVRVEATDPYGNVYSCEDVIKTDCWYPDYVNPGNVN